MAWPFYNKCSLEDHTAIHTGDKNMFMANVVNVSVSDKTYTAIKPYMKTKSTNATFAQRNSGQEFL